MSIKRPPRLRPQEAFDRLYDKWQIPTDDTPGAPVVTLLHDGADWVEMHAPRKFFEELNDRLAEGDTEDLEKWLAVLATPRKEPDPRLCGELTRRGNPCHMDRPCRHHPRRRN